MSKAILCSSSEASKLGRPNRCWRPSERPAASQVQASRSGVRGSNFPWKKRSTDDMDWYGLIWIDVDDIGMIWIDIWMILDWYELIYGWYMIWMILEWIWGLSQKLAAKSIGSSSSLVSKGTIWGPKKNMFRQTHMNDVDSGWYIWYAWIDMDDTKSLDILQYVFHRRNGSYMMSSFFLPVWQQRLMLPFGTRRNKLVYGHGSEYS